MLFAVAVVVDAGNLIINVWIVNAVAPFAQKMCWVAWHDSQHTSTEHAGQRCTAVARVMYACALQNGISFFIPTLHQSGSGSGFGSCARAVAHKSVWCMSASIRQQNRCSHLNPCICYMHGQFCLCEGIHSRVCTGRVSTFERVCAVVQYLTATGQRETEPAAEGMFSAYSYGVSF